MSPPAAVPMYARILVAIDGSEHGERALSHALGLAKAVGATLRIAHVVDMGWLAISPELAVDVGKVTASRLAEGERLVAAALERARAQGVEAHPRLIETGAAAQRTAATLVEEAAAWSADLLVLGARGRGAMERLLLGSVAEGVARRATLPVLLVH